MIRLFRRGRVWYARGSVKGTKVYQSLRTQFKDVAGERARDLDRELWSGRSSRSIAWEEFSQEFLSWITPHIKPTSYKKYAFVVHRFGKFLKKRNQDSLQAVTPASMTDYMQVRAQDLHPTRKTFIGQEGIKSDLRVLRRVFSYAVNCGYIESNPVRVPRLNTTGGKTLPFSREEIARILTPHDWEGKRVEWRAKILTFLYTGLRISDVAWLPKSAVNFRTGVITMVTRKRGNAVSIPIHPDLAEALQEHLRNLNPQRQSSPLMFPTQSGRPIWPQSLDAELRRHFARVGIERGHAHRFRDTFAVALLEQGATLYDVAKLLGITAAVAERHYTPYVEELRERGRRIVLQLNLQPGVVHEHEHRNAQTLL